VSPEIRRARRAVALEVVRTHRVSLYAHGLGTSRRRRAWIRACWEAPGLDPAPQAVVSIPPDDAVLMGLALDQARRAALAGEVPIGAVVALGGRVIGSAHNQPISSSDPTAHAEILALRQACRELGNYRLPAGAALYATVEPCPMCCGAMLHARVTRVVFGAHDLKAGAARSVYRLLEDPRLNHEVVVAGGVRSAECAALLTEFFKDKRS
jgi:tRNA(Arg) A34 adenosine deaminase TadA